MYFAVSKNLRLRQWYLDLFLGAGMAACIIGILQYFDMDPIGFKKLMDPEDVYKRQADSRLKDIIPPENSGPYAADSDVQGVYREQYGYSLESHTVRPADSQIQFGGNDWSGIMPNDEVTITYKHDRIPALWGCLLYTSRYGFCND